MQDPTYRELAEHSAALGLPVRGEVERSGVVLLHGQKESD
jgi:hypothetical protein